MSFLGKFRSALKLKPSEMRHPAQSLVLFDLVAGADDRLIEAWVGDGTESDIIMTPIRWLQRSIVEAPLRSVMSEDRPGPLQKLLDKPNPSYSMSVLLAATVYSLVVDGNAYWIVLRNARGVPVELWWAPHTMMEPKWPSDGSAYLSHYEYTPGGERKRIEVSDVLHFRDGLDPRNSRKGLSPLRSLLRDVWSDREAARFTGALLRNGGVPGLVISPKTNEEVIEKGGAEAIKARIDSGYTGENRGRTLVLTGAVDLNSFGFSPKEMDLSPLRDIGEERVSAALGIPAAVLGWGSGLQQTKVGATMRELRQLAWWQAVIPLQKTIAAEIQRQLATGETIEFDTDEVEALSESADAVAARIERLVRSGVMLRSEAREALGLKIGPADEVYLLSMATVEVPFTGREEEPDPEPTTEPEPPPVDPEKATKSSHALIEERLAASATRRKPPPAVRAFAAALDRLRVQSAAMFEEPLRDLFAELGEAAERAAMQVLSGKQLTPEDRDFAEKVLDILLAALDVIRGKLDEIYSAAYLRSARNVVSALSEAYGIEISLSDPAQVNLLRIGGTRRGLIDLSAQTREALFEAIAEGRSQGLASDNLARFIRDRVEAGPWRDAATRARVIARTEGAFAANSASIQAAREMPGVELMMIHDNRAGFDDEICAALDGAVVTIAEAEALLFAEHPNGTRSATPIPPLLAEEMGL